MIIKEKKKLVNYKTVGVTFLISVLTPEKEIKLVMVEQSQNQMARGVRLEKVKAVQTQTKMFITNM